MQLGYFTMPIHPLGKDWRQCPVSYTHLTLPTKA